MKLITFFYQDGTAKTVAVVDDSFDVQTWLREKRHELIDVARIEESIWQEYGGDKSADG